MQEGISAPLPRQQQDPTIVMNLAKRAHEEQNPAKMIELVKQLCAAIDAERKSKGFAVPTD